VQTKTFFISLFSFLLFISNTVFAQLPPPAVQARTWVLVDVTADQILAEYNSNKQVEPASLTKLMAAYLAFDALKSNKISMAQTVIPSTAVARIAQDESRMFVEANKPVTVHDLVYGLIVQSGNDAAIALAELLGGSEAGFIAMMNDTAQRLGMKQTHYANVNGLPDPQHYTSASDVALLSVKLIQDFPEYYPIFAEQEFTYNKIRQPNYNRLLAIDPTIDGVKTGHTHSAGYCLAASARRPIPEAPDVMRRLVSVVMGERSEQDRVQDSLKLLNYGYQAYQSVRLYKSTEPVSTARVYQGKSNTVKVGVKSDRWVAVPTGAQEKIKTVVKLDKPLIAPLADGQIVGAVEVFADDDKIITFPIVALHEVPQAGWFGRLWDWFLLLWQKKQ
jgi:serine-type D-Ala-D-Ala carboxypeptidase (penicillin-binding protein 5/6)